jgi:hypothetical protein
MKTLLSSLTLCGLLAAPGLALANGAMPVLGAIGEALATPSSDPNYGGYSGGYNHGGYDHGGEYNHGYDNNGPRTVTCSSRDHNDSLCSTGGRVRDVEVVKQYSDADCRAGETFGTRNGSIWVKGGCRATFRVK